MGRGLKVSQRVRATIDRKALAHNLGIARQHAPQSRIVAVIKANAYGHGLLPVAEALADSDLYAVTDIDEAEALRAGGTRKDILILQGIIDRSEIRRILFELTDAFRQRPADVRASLDVAVDLDVLQAKARFAAIVNGIAPDLAIDGRMELRSARHPLLIPDVRQRLLPDGDTATTHDVVPTDILLEPPARVLLITGPNTGGKTVAIKTAGLLALMAQAGLHVPAAPGSRLPGIS